jgi:hypothetical protein
MRKMYNVKPFVKLCGSFVELGEIDIPQKTQRKNITKNTKKKYHKKHKENLCGKCSLWTPL